jgi:hypothetical protein
MKICIDCGCTDDRACMTDDGPCYWASEDPPICSACVDRDEGRGQIECAHSFLYTTPSIAYCVHCGAEHVENAA